AFDEPARTVRLPRTVAAGDLFPVHYVPECADIAGAAILVLEVVGVCPPVQTEARRLAFHRRRVLVGGRGDAQRAIRRDQQPRPTGTEAGSGSLGKLLLERIKAAKRRVDSIRQVACRLAAAVGTHN